jgi:hypothetical protein
MSRAAVQKMSAQKIQQREKENPNDVNKVPVKTGHFDRRIIIGGKSSEPSFPQKPRHHAQTDNHMQGVKSGHHEINPKEDANFVAEFVDVQFAVGKITDFFAVGQITALLRLSASEASVQTKSPVGL